MKDPISIVLPTYNRVTTLRRVLGSYLEQEAVSEVVVVDDGSTDDTGGFIRSKQNGGCSIVYVRNESRRGSPASRNVGVKQARGEYILFGEDDLALRPGYGKKLLVCLNSNSASIAAGRIVYQLPGETAEQALTRVSSPVGDRIDRRQIFFEASAPADEDMEVPFIHAISLVRRGVFDDVMFDETFRGNAFREETDFYLRARSAGHRVYFCPSALCVHLPREVKTLGGNMAQGIWTYKYWSIRNNYVFLKRHHARLRREGLVTGGVPELMMWFTWSELAKVPSFYLRKYVPAFYSLLAKRMP
jgi:GT2 family glycosyltransferase